MNKQNDKNCSNVIIGNSDYDQVLFDCEKIVNGEVQCLTVGNSGSGKSYLIRNIIEELYAKKLGNILVIDPEGEYLSLRKLFDFVILGLNKDTCDILITEENAASLAVKMLKNKINVIIDVSYTDDTSRQEIISSYINSIIDNSSSMIYDASPLQIIIEETSKFARRGINTISNTKCITSLKRLAQLGRMRGISTFYNAQRVNQLPIAIRSDYNTMIIGKCLDDGDIKRYATIIGLRSGPSRELKIELRKLKHEFFAWGNGLVDNFNTLTRFKSLTPKSEHGITKGSLFSLPKSEIVIKWIELMSEQD